MTFEETDGGLDRPHESLGAAFKTRQRMENTQLTIAPCTVMIGMVLQRLEQRIFVGLQHGAPRNESCYPILCSCLFARVELPANDPQE